MSPLGLSFRQVRGAALPGLYRAAVCTYGPRHRSTVTPGRPQGVISIFFRGSPNIFQVSHYRRGTHRRTPGAGAG